jgi:hypothetical protein
MRVKTRAELPKDDPPTKTDGNETDAIVILTLFNGTFISGVDNIDVLPDPLGLEYCLVNIKSPKPVKYSFAYIDDATETELFIY